MRSTEQSKKAAFDAGYKLATEQTTYSRDWNVPEEFYIPADSWSFVRGFDQGWNDKRSAKR